jgi:hypothetical protein
LLQQSCLFLKNRSHSLLRSIDFHFIPIAKQNSNRLFFSLPTSAFNYLVYLVGQERERERERQRFKSHIFLISTNSDTKLRHSVKICCSFFSSNNFVFFLPKMQFVAKLTRHDYTARLETLPKSVHTTQ